MLCLQLQAKWAKAHYRVKHSKNEFAKGKNHINGIENVFASIMLANVSKSGYAKHRLSKFRGIKKENFCFTSKRQNLDTRLAVALKCQNTKVRFV